MNTAPIELGNGWRVAYDPLAMDLATASGWPVAGPFFCCTRLALLRCISEHCGAVDLAEVMRLPEWHPDQAAGAEPRLYR
jgi:hypothetical protein